LTAVGHEGLNQIGIAEIEDSGVVNHRRPHDAAGGSRHPALLAVAANGKEPGRTVTFDVNSAIAADGGKIELHDGQLDEPKNFTARIELVEPRLMGEIDHVVRADDG